MQSIQNDYDAVIVGSGPGGATVAKELSAQNKRVLILEWGNNAPLKGTFLQSMKMIGIPGKNVLLINKKLMMLIRGTTTGGSSTFFCATVTDPPFETLQSHGVDIQTEVEELKSEIPIAPLSDDLIGPMGTRVMESAQDLGYDWQKINKFIYQDKCKAGCWKCSFGCPYDAKWTARNFVTKALENGATLINGAKVKSVLRSGNSATGVEFSMGGRKHRVEAPTIILAAGGIGSAEILKRSGMENAGFNFFVDPVLMATGKVKDIKGGEEIPMQAGWHVKGEFMMTDLAVPKIPGLSIMIKIRDDLRGRITKSGGCRKDLSQDDYRKMDAGFAHAEKILKNAGVKTPKKSMGLASHPGGTVKIGELVDSNLKTELDNLYVCDCSVIPGDNGRPPTLTILGLGKRLAKHLEAQ